jgi:ABC-type phosphate transport system auxiliary subunit
LAVVVSGDIVERLRNHLDSMCMNDIVCGDAADEIERLRVQNRFLGEHGAIAHAKWKAQCAEVERLRAEVERLRAELDVERTANRITENHNHFDCAAELSRLRCENERLAGGRREQ